jgi:hypothetical protein
MKGDPMPKRNPAASELAVGASRSYLGVQSRATRSVSARRFRRFCRRAEDRGLALEAIE